MWSLPATLGGGTTMTSRGDPAGAGGGKRPASIQRRDHRSSKEAGSKVLGSFLELSSGPAVTRFSDIKKGASCPLENIKKPRLPYSTPLSSSAIRRLTAISAASGTTSQTISRM